MFWAVYYGVVRTSSSASGGRLARRGCLWHDAACDLRWRCRFRNHRRAGRHAGCRRGRPHSAAPAVSAPLWVEFSL